MRLWRQNSALAYRQADVSYLAFARALVGGVIAEHGRLDILVNNAATTEVIAHGDRDAATPRGVATAGDPPRHPPRLC